MMNIPSRDRLMQMARQHPMATSAMGALTFYKALSGSYFAGMAAIAWLAAVHRPFPWPLRQRLLCFLAVAVPPMALVNGHPFKALLGLIVFGGGFYYVQHTRKKPPSAPTATGTVRAAADAQPGASAGLVQ